jgi:hypothetical protein
MEGPVMAGHHPLDADADPFRPPAIPTLVACLHCGQEYDSARIERRVENGLGGRRQGFWCCPTPGCSGVGFGFDILPVDPDYRDERGGWVFDAEPEEQWLDGDDASPASGVDADPGDRPPRDEDEEIPW